MTKEKKREELQVHIGDSLDGMARRFVDAWHRAERGELTDENAERHVAFETFETLSRIVTPIGPSFCAMCIGTGLEASARLPLRSAAIIDSCTRTLQRSWKRVCDESGLHADYEAVKIETRVAL